MVIHSVYSIAKASVLLHLSEGQRTYPVKLCSFRITGLWTMVVWKIRKLMFCFVLFLKDLKDMLVWHFMALIQRAQFEKTS